MLDRSLATILFTITTPSRPQQQLVPRHSNAKIKRPAATSTSATTRDRLTDLLAGYSLAPDVDVDIAILRSGS